jgi:hypothetical protein
MDFYRYSSIGQFRDIVSRIRKEYKGSDMPRLDFQGTVKAHGTNASVIVLKSGEQIAQSRSRMLSINDDNYGFALWHSKNIPLFESIRNKITTTKKDIIFYGEWVGKGIQNKVAVCNVDRFFYLFGVKVLNADGTHYWLSDYPFLSEEGLVLDSRDVITYSINIDFESPENYINNLIGITEKVENECPIGKHFNISGTGEGVVWEHINDKGQSLKFKVKGNKHASSKVKKLASVDPEKLKSIDDFVEYAVTQNRLLQGVNEIGCDVPDMYHIGVYISWINRDIIKEEKDTLENSGLVYKDVQRKISAKARSFYVDKFINF